jgi:CheY-like chemotaxis protein
MTKILVVEDEFITGADLQNTLSKLGYDVPGVVNNGIDAITQSGKLRPDVVLMDITLAGDMTGTEAAKRIKDLYDIPIVFLTAHSDDPTIEAAKVSEPFGYIIKPYEIRDLKITLEIAIYKHAIDKKLHEREQTIRALLNTIPDALVLLDEKKQIIAANETMSQKLKKPRDALEGTCITDLIASGVVPVQVPSIDEVYRTGQTVYLEEHQDNQWFETMIYPVRDHDRSIAWIAIQSHNITWRKHLEDELKKVGVTQIEQNMEQFQILNDQIRNPLQVLMFYLEISGGEFRPKIEEQIRYIDNLVTKLDKGWVESTKVRSFLLKHYQHGADNPLEPQECGGR